MKYFYLILTLVCLNVLRSSAQERPISGTIIDSTKLSLPGSNIKMKNELGDSSVTIANVDGKFTFPAVKGTKITLVISSIGYEGLIKHFTLPADGKAVILDPITLKSSTKQLGAVTIVGVNPVVFKEDTVQYSVSAYKVRENAPIEDVLKKIPGIDVAKDGTVSSQGKQITKVRVNGKDFFGGDVQSATKNLPADVIESVQVVDDYGDQANLTGVKTGEPNKILNFTIRKDKNYGYFGQATAGDGRDALPKKEGADIKNDNRYIGLVNFFKFKGDQQISVLGNLNNTNVNTFSYGAATGAAAGGSGFGGGGGGGGGGRGNAARGGSSGSTTNANGITNARSIGLNFRDQWGKTLSVYGSYSFSNNTTYTNSTTLQNNYGNNPSQSTQASQETSKPTNHRFNFNLEWKPDTLNYLKVTPSFTYSATDVNSFDDQKLVRNDTTRVAYTSNSVSNSTSPSYGLTGFFNHRFKNSKRNLLIGFNVSTNNSSQFDNPVNTYTVGAGTTPANQVIFTDGRNTTYGANVSYQEPIGKVSFLELNYAFNHNFTSSYKETDTLYTSNPDLYHNYALLSNNYNYTFTTNRFGLNYRVIEKKYNLTLGVGAQPAKLDGINLSNNVSTSVSTFNVIPAASFNYNFSRSQALRFNYNGSSNQPAFNQLQPVLDFSNALYPVQGNPNLNPEFTNNLSLRYNAFSFQTGNIFLVGLNYSQTDNKIVQNTVNYASDFTPAALAADPSLVNFRNATLIKYLNTDGYYTAGANIIYSKPWKERRYTVTFNGNASYTNNIGFSQSVTEANVTTPIEKNIAKTLSLSPRLSFRTNVTDIIDAELYGKYTVSKTDNSLTTLGNQNTNIRSLELGLNGKNYVWKDWTVSYDYTKTLNYGYDEAVNIKNPNILNAYLERRFLKDHRGTLRLAAYDLFNENTGFATTTNGSTVTQTNVNRLGRYYLLTFTFRLQKFSGKAPSADPGRGMRDGGGRQGGMGGGGGMGGPPPGGGPF